MMATTTRDLTNLAQYYLSDIGDVNFQQNVRNSEIFEQLVSVIKNEGRTEATLASIFLQNFKLSREYKYLLENHDIPIPSEILSDFIVVGCGGYERERLGLVILHNEYNGEPFVIEVEGFDTQESWHKWIILLEKQFKKLRRQKGVKWKTLETYYQYIEIFNNPYIFESLLYNTMPMGILIIKKPKMTYQMSSIAHPCWGVSTNLNTDPIFTAGPVVRDVNGSVGVLCCRHGLDPTREYHSLKGKNIWINGVKAIVKADDIISDSCFAELENGIGVPYPRGVKGPLIGLAPRIQENVTFEGITTGEKTTKITQIDVGIPMFLSGHQPKIYTPAVTSPGDSGAALIDQDDHILGFAFGRTEFGEEIEFSSWIWAHSVYNTLQLETDV